MRIVILAKVDCAGSGQRYAEALRHAGHHAVMCAEARSTYGYALDQRMDNLHAVRKVQELIDAADVVHFKGDHLPSQYVNLHTQHKPRVITAGGSGFRRKVPGLPATACHRWHALDAYAAECHALGAITPDLLYLPGMRWVPHATPIRNAWRPPVGEVVIGHSPSSRRAKGTDAVVIPAVEMLRAMGHNVRLLLIEGKSNRECLIMKAQCHLFFDQALIPAYGLSGVEAMAMGIPVVNRMAGVLVQDREPFVDPVVAFAEPTPMAAAGSIAAALQRLPELHAHTLQWVREVHAYPAVAEQLVGLYKEGMHVHELAAG